MGMLDGKVALITGGSRGQGRAHAITCAKEGADVIIIDTLDQIESVAYPMAQQADFDETVRQVEDLDRRIVSVVGDVRKQADLDRAVSEGIASLGRIDILIANAGIFSLAPAHELTDEQWDDMIAVNLTGVWKSAKAVLPHMMEQGGGSIVITSSINGIEPGANYAHYCSSKFGVVGLMKTLALEYANHGIRVNSVHPGAILTPMTSWQGAWDMMSGKPAGEGTEDDMLEAGYHFHALKGNGFLSPQRIADAALYLNSDLASAVTGVTLPVDAGHLLIPGVNASPVRA
ncbi:MULTISPECIES: mycofactocin-coupled SDR family oxidoreductase [Microcella]|uniref:Mycofactocin-coupled SDR family oxidoreductase n=1 Tax=Microcella pacifica TaxID=2591847 RepID=A0A9E5JMD6_9MICO|nr:MULTISPECIES: mycofactocin-coupled SDR family oxidoreductase [Microcella]MBR22776.1 SDR family mycofactocin-dependent oxidoreductase [Leifsonia sp.]MBU1250803.1 mycofactocin-coupled SDR family oxidoreductase [Actinomycetota bacterium]MBU1609822.1 mycofactocin-coupled SDR family oxidoreductase [Actinomycetota bacterium]MBU2316322.1 mycofactocin-coupled SDR family oxidoreductase [Actinomycetota bacterium]MBU2385215.1 mycofactocin-coupled SDR family oxidoreductase [Actinomycetota bacterium]